MLGALALFAAMLVTPVAGLAVSSAVALPTSPAAKVSSSKAPPEVSSTSSADLSRFLSYFSGHFDNRAQTIEDRAAGLTPRQGGGHEHIHCHVQPVDIPCTAGTGGASVAGTGASGWHYALASYYFDDDSSKIFRERLYAVREVLDDHQFGNCLQMSMFALRDSTAASLRDNDRSAAAVDWCATEDVSPALQLPGCDVFWRRQGSRFDGRMRTESVVVQSPTLGMPIVVRDDVTLWHDALWVNDRGWDTAGNYLYGHYADVPVPYKLRRIRSAPTEDSCDLDFESWLSRC